MTLEKNLTEIFNREGKVEISTVAGQRAVTVGRPDLRASVTVCLANQNGDVDAHDLTASLEEAARMAYGAGWPGAT